MRMQREIVTTLGVYMSAAFMGFMIVSVAVAFILMFWGMIARIHRDVKECKQVYQATPKERRSKEVLKTVLLFILVIVIAFILYVVLMAANR
jgi:uncharacterized membrane protein